MEMKITDKAISKKILMQLHALLLIS